MNETTTTTAREGIQTLGTVDAGAMGWDAAEDMPDEYGRACMELTAETLTRAGMLVLGVLGDTDLVYMEGDDVCVWSSEAWAQWLQTLAKFHDYSLNNTMLIAMQMPEATRVASYRSWQRDFGRHVKKGEHGIEVLVPMVVKSRLGDPEEAPRDDAEEAVERRRLVGFKVGHVFDVSQTEGEQLPTIAEHVSSEVERYDEVMGAIEAVSAYPIEVVDGLPPETNGLFSRMGYIAIRSGMPQGQTVKTALHELAHSVLHDGDAEGLPDRAMREVQAESVAYAVSAALGLDTSGYSFGYVASWAVGKTDEEMRQCMQVVRDAAKDIIDRMDIVLAA